MARCSKTSRTCISSSASPSSRVAGGSSGVDSGMAFVEPVTLRGTHVMLEPLAREHEAGLKDAAADGELWHLWYTSVPTPDKTLDWIDAALAMRENLGAMPFVVREPSSGDIVGST